MVLIIYDSLFTVAIQCLESTYGVSTQDPKMAKKLAVSKNLLDIFNSQMASEVNNASVISSK